MNKVILHISDLHVSMHTNNDGSSNSKVDSYLTTNMTLDESNHFIDKFIDDVKKEFANSEFILAITGDISNMAEIKEFEFAQKFILRLMSGLNIQSSNCLLLPGDHDVHRRSIENELEHSPQKNAHLLHEVKFKHFSKLYSEIKQTNFPYELIIIDHLIIDSKVVLLGINSNYHIGNSGGNGFIPIEKFKSELDVIKKQNNEKLHYIAFWHHNFTAGFDNTNAGQWEVENRKHLLAELERQNIKFIFTGNEHTSNCKAILMGSIMASDSGTLTSIKNDATFKAYPIKINADIKLENRIYALQRPNGNDLAYFWNVRSNSNAKQPAEFEVFLENKQAIDEVIELPSIEDDQQIELEEKKEEVAERVFYNNPEISDNLYSIVRDKKVFHSGHFHWSETSRAHNWIDVSKLLEDNKNLFFVQNAIINVIEAFNLNEECDLIIGLGYEGNIISSKPAIKFDIPYTSLPYSYRYNDHHEYEKKLNFENNDGSFKKVIIITDVVNDGRTIRKLISKRESKFFEKVNEIIVVSLFYTGHSEINTNILNYNRQPANYDFENDHEVNNIEFYTVKTLRVEKCPYGKDYKKECFIYKDDLSCVHLFYDEKSKISLE